LKDTPEFKHRNNQKGEKMCNGIGFHEAVPEFQQIARQRGRGKGTIDFMFLCLVLIMLLSVHPAAAGDNIFPMEITQGSAIGVGVGIYPDYIGSDDYTVGAVPLIRIPFAGQRYISLIANELRVNILNDDHWRLGPSLVYRIGRKNVEDDVVKRVHDVDGSLDAGAFIGYEWYEKSQPLMRVGVSAFFQADVTDAYGGWTSGAQLYGSYPVMRPLTLMAGVGTTYGSGSYMDTYFGVTPQDSINSGLPTYEAKEGFRDARCWITAMFHFSQQWHAGMGFMYSGLFDEAGDSPIVSERGSKTQWLLGPLALYTW
jgi:outer membrane protein